MEKQQLQQLDLIDKVKELLKKYKISAYEINLNIESGLSTTVRLGNVESIQYHQSQNFSIDVYSDNKKGSANSVDFTTESLKKTIEAAYLIAKYTSKDKYLGLPPKNKLAFNVPDLDMYYPWDLQSDKSVAISLECEQAALENKYVNNTEGAELSTFNSFITYANSKDLVISDKRSEHSLYCNAIAKNKSDMQVSYDYSVAIDNRDLKRAKFIGTKAAKLAVAKLNSSSLKSQKCSVIFHANIASGLFSALLSALSGTKQYHKSTFLLNSIDKIIFPDWINIYEDPLRMKTIGVRAFDSDGVKTKKQYFIKNGAIKSYLLSQYSANQLGSKTTANAGGVHNLIINTSKQNFKDLLKTMDEGILVTELMGQGINITTGDYSRGASGFWVENGEIKYPVSGFTVADNLENMFNNIVAISDDTDKRKNIKTGSVLISEMTIGGD